MVFSLCVELGQPSVGGRVVAPPPAVRLACEKFLRDHHRVEEEEEQTLAARHSAPPPLANEQLCR